MPFVKYAVHEAGRWWPYQAPVVHVSVLCIDGLKQKAVGCSYHALCTCYLCNYILRFTLLMPLSLQIDDLIATGGTLAAGISLVSEYCMSSRMLLAVHAMPRSVT